MSGSQQEDKTTIFFMKVMKIINEKSFRGIKINYVLKTLMGRKVFRNFSQMISIKGLAVLSCGACGIYHDIQRKVDERYFSPASLVKLYVFH